MLVKTRALVYRNNIPYSIFISWISCHDDRIALFSTLTMATDSPRSFCAELFLLQKKKTRRWVRRLEIWNVDLL